jgi:hypothetical protein
MEERNLGAMLGKMNAGRTEATADVKDTLAAEPLSIEVVIPAANREAPRLRKS